MHSSVKKLWLKYEYHTLELEETQGEFKKRKAEFEFAFRKKYDKLPVLQKSFIDSMLTEQNAGTAVIPPPRKRKERATHIAFLKRWLNIPTQINMPCAMNRHAWKKQLFLSAPKT